jgi:hypothetical protein
VEVLALFQSGQLDISNGICAAARDDKERIIHHMTVLLIQGALYSYAYINDRQSESGKKEEVAAAVFAALILPPFNSCSPADALLAATIKMPTHVRTRAAVPRSVGYDCGYCGGCCGGDLLVDLLLPSSTPTSQVDEAGQGDATT